MPSPEVRELPTELLPEVENKRSQLKDNTVTARFAIAKWAPLFLLAVLFLAAYLRFSGLAWDDSYHLHPDERFLTEVAGLLKSTDPISYLKTSESTLNPYNFGKTFYVYGNFPMTITRLAAELADGFCQRFQAVCEQRFIFYDGIHLVGRFLSALLDLISIAFTFFIGRRLYDWRAGIIAAFLMSVSVMAIQQSHFFTMDNWAAALTMATLYAAVRASEEGGRFRWWVLFGISLGLTVASRINVAPLAIMAVAAAATWLVRRKRDKDAENIWAYLQTHQGSIDLQKTIFGVLLAAVISMLVFRIAQPYAFADSQIVRETAIQETGQLPGTLSTIVKSIVGFNPQWLDNMKEIQGLQSPDATFPPALQWTSREPLIFPLTNMVLWGMGLTAGIAAILAFFWALWRIILQKQGWESHVILVSWTGLYFLFMGTRWVKSIRYFLPIYPALMLLAGWALVELWRKADRNRFRQLLVIAALLFVLVPPLLWAISFLNIYHQPVTRVAASAWIFENVPTGATLVYEVDGIEDELHLPLRRYDFQPGGPPLFLNFSVPKNSDAVRLRLNYVKEAEAGTSEVNDSQLRIRLVDAANGSELYNEVVSYTPSDEREPLIVDLPAVPLSGDGSYTVAVELAGGKPLTASTSVLANEHWDDPLPVRYEGIDPYSSYYEGLSTGLIPITVPDSELKREDLLSWINEADYIFLSSQRALWSLPRLPRTFPLTTRYYEALFSGELGFDLVDQFQADLAVGPLYISDVAAKIGWQEPAEFGWPPPGDLAAEEAFSVYDHPPVWIFQKGDDFRIEDARTILESVDLSEAIFMTPGQATRAEEGMLLSTAEFQDRQENGTFSRLFALDGLYDRYPWFAAVIWWLAVTVLALAAFPLTATVFRGLPDRGYPLARILSLLVIAYLGWIVASLGLLPNNRLTLIAAAVVLVCISLAILIFRWHELRSFISKNRRYILFTELFSLFLFVFFILIRMGNPDVWDVIWGGEKPMDLAYFNAILKGDTFPPYDPWFAGGFINYYYFGFVYVGALTELLGIPPTTAYNLILPMLFSFTGVAAFSTAYNLIISRIIRRKPRTVPGIWSRKGLWGGLFAAALCVLLGNLAEVPVTLNAWRQASDSTVATGLAPVDTAVKIVDGAVDLATSDRVAPIYPGDWFWSASRAITADPGEVQPITEFPFFTFLYGDLHAHMIALPITVFVLAWVISIALLADKETARGWPRSSKVQFGVSFVVGAMAAGSLWATNSWDYPTYLGLAILALLFFSFHNRRQRGLNSAALAIGLVLGFVGLSMVLFYPFTAHYGRAYSSFSLWQGSYTTLSSYFVIYGLFIFIILFHLIKEFRSWTGSWTVTSLARWESFALIVFGALIAAILLTIFLFVRGYNIAILVFPLALLSGLLALRPKLPTERRIVLVLISAALFLTLLVEIIVLDGDIGRMNTVFKFYLQVWVMLSIVAGAAVVWIGSALRYRPVMRTFWRIGLTILILASALYPILATKAKWDIRMSDEAPLTLDGMAFMKTTTYVDTAYDGTSRTIELSGDYDAIRWMQRNIEGSPVIAEAHSSNPYRSIGNRVSMYTGLPAVIGWDWHQRQQRALMPGYIVSDRIDDVNRLYNTTNVEEAASILEKYGVKYVYEGQLERTYYLPEGLTKFEQMVDRGLLSEVYSSDNVSIYEVLEGGA